MLFKVIAQIKNVIGGNNALPRKDVNRVGDGARVCQSRRFAPNHLLQIAQASRKHIRWRRKTGCFGCAQKVHRVNGIETDLLISFRRPITERALIVLPASQNSKDFFELSIHLCAIEPEIGFICEHEPAKRAARDLLAAAVGKVLEKNIKTVRETKRDCRDRGLALGKLGIDLTSNL